MGKVVQKLGPPVLGPAADPLLAASALAQAFCLTVGLPDLLGVRKDCGDTGCPPAAGFRRAGERRVGRRLKTCCGLLEFTQCCHCLPEDPETNGKQEQGAERQERDPQDNPHPPEH